MKTQNRILFETFLATLNEEKRKEFEQKPELAKQAWYIGWLESEIFDYDAQTFVSWQNDGDRDLADS